MIHQRTLSNPGARRRTCVRRRAATLAMLVALLAVQLPALAEDERGRWTIGFGGGILSTFDDIRSNAAVVELDNIGRVNDISDDNPIDWDTRQDDLLGRETSNEEVQTFNFSVAYGLTPWLSLQVDLGYYEGNVSNLDTFRMYRHYAALDSDNVNDDPLQTPLHDASVPINVGQLEQIPMTVSAIFRFRRDSPFNPILGAGVGWVFTDLQDSQAFSDLNAEILRGFQRTQLIDGSASNMQLITDVHGNPVVNSDCAMPANRFTTPTQACTRGIAELEIVIQSIRELAAQDPGNADYYRLVEEEYRNAFAAAINSAFIPTRPLVIAEVDDGFAYQLTGGAEYHFNDNWSVYMIGRYLATKADLRVRITDNGNLFTARPTDPGLETVQPVKFSLKEALIEFNAQGNLEDPLVQVGPTLDDEIYVQGGDINLTSFSLIFGLRYTF